MTVELTSAAELLAFWAIAGYLLGAIPFGIVTARILGLGDLRKIGSGNIGATNVLRTGSKLGAALTLIGDAGKAGAAVLLARALAAEDAAQISGFAAFFGHCYPIWLKFKGGKGVATFFGLLFALSLADWCRRGRHMARHCSHFSLLQPRRASHRSVDTSLGNPF